MQDRQDPEERLREMQEVLSDLKALLAHKGWQRIERLLEDQQLNREKQIFKQPLESLDQTLRQEFEKGEAHGIYLARVLPRAHIGALEEEIEQIEEQLDGNEPDRDDDREPSEQRRESDYGDFEPPV